MKKFFILLAFSLGCICVMAQGIQLKGTVTDNEGVSLPGVSILVEGTNIGAASDMNGNYSIHVPNENSVLVFSLIGFIQQKINVRGRSGINVSLTKDTKSLDEVIVVGYGVQKKASVVGAIGNVDVKELRRAAPSNLSNAIGGRVPGLITRMGDGAPGGSRSRYSNGDNDDAQVYIRGQASLNNTAALVLIDGVEGSLSRVNPNDIEQFSVLKDASATAVYGVRGANGVILITTRKGTAGKPKMEATTQFRMMKPLDFPDYLGAYDYAMLFNEALKNAGSAPRFSDADLEAYRTGSDPYGHPDVNWKDVLLKPNGGQFMEQQHVASASGGTENVRYYISGEYNQSGGPFVGSKAFNTEYRYQRYNLRSNLDFNFTRNTQFSVQVNGRLNDLNYANKGESTGQRVEGVAWSDIAARNPVEALVINPDGSYAAGQPALTNNPYADMIEGGYSRRSLNSLQTNFQFNQKLDFVTPGLAFRALYGLTYDNSSQKVYRRTADLYKYNPATDTYTLTTLATAPTNALESYFADFRRVQQAEASLTYNRTVAEDHAIGAMITGIHTTNDLQANLPVFFRGLAGRVTYGYKEKYLLEGNVGYNGSDAFQKGQRYAFFPAAAIGWVPSNETFFRDNIKFIDFLKFRASYGEIGNDKLGSFAALYQYTFTAPTVPGPSNNEYGYFSFGQAHSTIVPLREGTLGNDQVTWETARKRDIGVEARMFKSRLSLEADVFLEKRDDILLRRSDVLNYIGLASGQLPAYNLGRVTNKGYELALSYSDNIRGFGFTVGGNYTFARNTVDFKGEQLRNYPWQYETGKPFRTPRAYIWTGKFYSQEDIDDPLVAKPLSTVYAGELMFEDLNGDNVIDSDDQAVTGYSQIPEKIFAINLNMDYKNFYINTFWQGASNVTNIMGGPLRYEFNGTGGVSGVQPFHMEDRWVYDPSRGLDTRATAKYPVLIQGGAPQTRQASTFHHINGEYLRLKTAEFGYTFPKTITDKLRVSDLRVFLSGLNLLTFSHMKKYKLDPEYLGNNIPGQDATNGLGTGAYSPQNKFYALGLNVTF